MVLSFTTWFSDTICTEEVYAALGINHLYDIFEEIDSKLEDKGIITDLTSTTIELKEIEIVKTTDHRITTTSTSTVNGADIPSKEPEAEIEQLDSNSIKANYDFCEDIANTVPITVNK